MMHISLSSLYICRCHIFRHMKEMESLLSAVSVSIYNIWWCYTANLHSKHFESFFNVKFGIWKLSTEAADNGICVYRSCDSDTFKMQMEVNLYNAVLQLDKWLPSACCTAVRCQLSPPTASWSCAKQLADCSADIVAVHLNFTYKTVAGNKTV